MTGEGFLKALALLSQCCTQLDGDFGGENTSYLYFLLLLPLSLSKANRPRVPRSVLFPSHPAQIQNMSTLRTSC